MESALDGLLSLVGSDIEVPLVTGERARYLNLDCAASTPALAEVDRAVQVLLSWYSGVHRGHGYKSMVCTEAYEGARQAVGSFVGARSDDVVIFTRNTTDSCNLLASALPEDCSVVAFETEHHANLLPWRSRDATFLVAPASPDQAAGQLTQELSRRRHVQRPCLVALTGASNVTGEVWPVRELTQIAHQWGARVLVDVAQLAPHRPVNLALWGADYLAFSGHKCYAPYGAGALVGRPDWLRLRDPYLAGGGAVRLVTRQEVLWKDLPGRQEAGSPNVIGAVALGVACQILQRAGMARLAAAEEALLRNLERDLDQLPGIERYSLWRPYDDRIGVITFNLAGYHHSLLAASLSAEFGIGVRSGRFCAHPLMLHLLHAEPSRQGRREWMPGAVRASFGIGTSEQDLDRFVSALRSVERHGPKWRYEAAAGSGEYVPHPDPRGRPAFPFALSSPVGG